MTKDELIAEIEALRGIVAMGQDKLKESQYLDMELMQAKVDAACQVVADFSPDDAVEIREPLSALLGDLQSYSNFVGEHQENLENTAEDSNTTVD
tara:strand:- start:169 stop:453 length:285 start_codon:yes stop_codon:yes gene_type:complete